MKNHFHLLLYPLLFYFSIITLNAQCPPPTGITLTSVGYSHFAFNWNNEANTTYNVRYRLQGASTWVNLTDYSSHVSGNKIPCSTYEWQVQSVCNSTPGPWSILEIVNTLGCGDLYCYSYGLSWDHWIESVAFSDMSNGSGNEYGHADFNSQVANVEQGQSYVIALDPDTDVASTTVYWNVWIDWNADNDFNDSGELVVSKTGDSQNLSTETINIPANAAIGVTRMRVTLSPTTFATTCQVGGDLDVEDYGINIQPPPCSIPTGFVVDDVGYAIVDLGWQAVPGATAYQTRRRLVGAGSWEIGSWYTSTGVLWGNSDPCSTYEFQVRTDCNGFYSDYSSSIFATTEGCGDPYCYSYGLSWDHWVESVSFSDMSQPSGNGYGYTDYTSSTANVEKGETYSITLDPDTDVASTTVYWRVWIDWNADNDFNDTGEEVVSVSGNSQTATNEIITIPTSATLGVTRMRVALSPTAFSTSCQTGGSLDVEDFSVNILPQPCSVPVGFNVDDTGYAVVELSWQPVTGATAYQTRRRLSGTTTWQDGSWFTGTSVLWGNSEPCSTYEFQVRADCNGSFSDYSNSTFGTTEGCGDPYCYSYGLSWDHWIESVDMADMSQASGNGYGYSNYTSITANVEKGETYVITLGDDSDVASTTVYWQVWIDWNADNDFDDTGEQVVSLSATSVNQSTQNIVVPTNAVLGPTRMRVSLSPTSFATTCQEGGSLDVEDYSVNILPEPCAVPTGFMVDDVGYAVVDISWQPVSGATAYQTRRRLSGTSTWELGNWFTTTSVFWGISDPCSTYEFQVRTDCNGAFSDFSNSIFATTEGCGDPYCYSYGLSWDHWIESVDFADLNQPSGNGYGYTNFTAATANVQQTETYSITLDPDTDVAPTTVYWQVWVDWNADNDFEDTGELVVTNSGDSQTAIAESITIPATATLGITRMRVALSPSTFATNCQIGGSLDVEDYSVNINPPPPFLIATPPDVNFVEQGGVEIISVSSNVSWTASETESWLSLSPDNGNGDGSFTITCDANPDFNPRSGSIEVQGGGIIQIITVTQQAASASLSVNPDSVSFSGAGGNETIAVSANIGWTVTENASWLSVDPDNGSGNGFFTINCVANNTSSGRSTTVSVNGGGLAATVFVYQEPQSATLNANPSTFNVDAQNDCVTSNITSNIDWNIINPVPWVSSVTPSSGSNNATVTICYTTNTSAASRTGTLQLSGGGLSQDITITQAGQADEDISFDPANIVLDWLGTAVTGTINTNNGVAWTATVSDSWLEVDQISGTGAGPLMISSSSPNSGSSPRSGTVTLNTATSSFVINVTQAAEVVSGPPWGEPEATIMSGSMIGQIQINGVSASSGDWIAAFDEDNNLAGSQELIINQGIAYMNLVIYGDDSNTPIDEGINPGEAFTLKLYDASENRVLDYPNSSDIFLFTEWANTNGAPMPAYNSPNDIYNFEIGSLLFSPAVINLDWIGSAVTGNLTIDVNQTWTATPSDSWIAVNPGNALGSQAVVISANSPNTTGAIRSGSIEFSGGGSTVNVTVTQAQQLDDGPPWGNPEVTIASGALIGQIQINGEPAEAGDWIGAFDEGNNLAGSKEVIINQGVAYTNLVIYGDDTNTAIDEGINQGEAFTLRLYDASESRILEYPNSGAVFSFTEWMNTNGAPMPAYNDPNTVYNFATVSYDTIPLKAGWNLVSTDVSPADSSVSAIVSGLIPGNLEYVTGFDGVANFYDPALPDIFSTLTHWKPGFGYWVKVFEDDMLILEGQQIEPTYFKPMDENWNLIAYLPQAAQAPETYLSDFINEGQLEYVTGFDDVFEFYDPFGLPFLNTLSEMRNSKGYWVKLQNLGQQPDTDGTPGFSTIHNLPNPNYEFILGYTDAPEGAILDLVDENGTIWTRFEVAQEGMLMPKALYSDDESTPFIKEGPPANALLNFKWNGRVSPLNYQSTGDLEVHEVEVNFGLNADYSLLVNPTPFREELQIRFDLPAEGEAFVLITDVNGNLVWQSPLNPKASGTQYIRWRPEGQSAGLYFISLYQMGRPVARTKAMFVR